MLSHIDETGKAKMVDVTSKAFTVRKAFAKGTVYVGEKILSLIADNNIQKGDVLATAKIAGILAAKKTGALIPLCHPLNITFADIKFQLDTLEKSVIIFSEVAINAPTGVEMEALTAVNIAALTIYDMCKGVDKSIFLGESSLLKKTGGKSGTFKNSSKIQGYVAENIEIGHNKGTEVEIIGILPEIIDSGDMFQCGANKIKAEIIEGKAKFFSKTLLKITKGEKICLL
jgi:cyclic pyranopterin phosphate synthase